MTEHSDYYDLLGVRVDASEREIERAYCRSLREHYAREASQPDAEGRVTAFTEAYAALIDPESREEYDERTGLSPRRRRPHPGFHLGLDLGVARVSIGVGHRHTDPPD